MGFQPLISTLVALFAWDELFFWIGLLISLQLMNFLDIECDCSNGLVEVIRVIWPALRHKFSRNSNGFCFPLFFWIVTVLALQFSAYLAHLNLIFGRGNQAKKLYSHACSYLSLIISNCELWCLRGSSLNSPALFWQITIPFLFLQSKPCCQH